MIKNTSNLWENLCIEILKSGKNHHYSMIQRQELEQIMSFVAKRWLDLSRDPDNKALKTLPSDFWMNSVGGKTANGGYWVTTLFYTENQADADAFKDVLLRWQSRGMQKNENHGPDLIQIGKKNTI